jgi:hypothetical protein
MRSGRVTVGGDKEFDYCGSAKLIAAPRSRSKTLKNVLLFSSLILRLRGA